MTASAPRGARIGRARGASAAPPGGQGQGSHGEGECSCDRQGGAARADGKSRRRGGAGGRACCSQASVVAQPPAPRASASSAAAAPRGSAMPNGATGHSANSAPSLASTNSAKRCQPCGAPNANAAARRRAAPARPTPLRGVRHCVGWLADAREADRSRLAARVTGEAHVAWRPAAQCEALRRLTRGNLTGLARRLAREPCPPQGEFAGSLAGHVAARRRCAGAAGPPAGTHRRPCSCSSKRCSGSARSATWYRRHVSSLVSSARCTLLPARAPRASRGRAAFAAAAPRLGRARCMRTARRRHTCHGFQARTRVPGHLHDGQPRPAAEERVLDQAALGALARGARRGGRAARCAHVHHRHRVQLRVLRAHGQPQGKYRVRVGLW